MLPGVRHDVRDDLQQSIRIPMAERIADNDALHLPLRVRQFEFAHGLRAQIGKVALVGIDGDAASRTGASEIEELLDHRRHALTARQNATEGFALPFCPWRFPLQGRIKTSWAAVIIAPSGFRRSCASTPAKSSLYRIVSSSFAIASNRVITDPR